MVKYIYCLYENSYKYGDLETTFIGYYNKFEDLLEKMQDSNYNILPKKGYINNTGCFYNKFEILKNTKYIATVFNDTIILDVLSLLENDKELLYKSIRIIGLKKLLDLDYFTIKLLEYNKLSEIDEFYYKKEKISLTNKNELISLYPEYKEYIEIHESLCDAQQGYSYNITFYFENTNIIDTNYRNNTNKTIDNNKLYNILKILEKDDYEINSKKNLIEIEKNKIIKSDKIKKQIDEYILDINYYSDIIKNNILKLSDLQIDFILNSINELKTNLELYKNINNL